MSNSYTKALEIMKFGDWHHNTLPLFFLWGNLVLGDNKRQCCHLLKGRILAEAYNRGFFAF